MIQSLQSKINDGKLREARREALKYLHTGLKNQIIDMFKHAEQGTFICEQCKEETEQRYLPLFLMYDSNHNTCDQCNEKIVRAHEQQKASDKIKALDLWRENINMIADNMIETAGVPVIFQSASMRDLGHGTAKALDSHQSYFIKGDVGVGKSHMAIALMRAYITELVPVYDERKKEYYLHEDEYVEPIFIEVPELLLRIRDTYNENSTETEKDIVEHFARTPFLVLDDLGSEKASEFSTLMLYLIINRRCTSGKTTIITSNLNLDEIEDRLSDRISSRIKGMCCVMNIAGHDRRYERKTGDSQKQQTTRGA